MNVRLHFFAVALLSCMLSAKLYPCFVWDCVADWFCGNEALEDPPADVEIKQDTSLILLIRQPYQLFAQVQTGEEKILTGTLTKTTALQPANQLLPPQLTTETNLVWLKRSTVDSQLGERAGETYLAIFRSEPAHPAAQATAILDKVGHVIRLIFSTPGLDGEEVHTVIRNYGRALAEDRIPADVAMLIAFMPRCINLLQERSQFNLLSCPC